MNVQLGAVLSALSTEAALVFARHDGGPAKAAQREIMDLITRAERDPAAFVAEREAQQTAAIAGATGKLGVTTMAAAWDAAIAKARAGQ